MEPNFPQDLRDSNGSRRSVHVTPSLTTDSEHEVLVELNSDSDIPSSKARKDRHASSATTTDRKKIADRRKRTSTSPFPGGGVVTEDLLHDMIEQNRFLMSQNKALTKRVGLLEPAVPSVLPPEAPVTCNHPLHPDIPLIPEPFPQVPVPEPTQLVDTKSKKLDDDKLYAQYKEIWDVLPRLLRIIEAASKPANTDSAVTSPSGPPLPGEVDYDFMARMQFECCPQPSSAQKSLEEMLFDCSRSTCDFLLLEAEQRFGVHPKLKKGKKTKSKFDTGSFSKANLVPGFWKGLGLVRVLVLIFIMMQLYYMGGEVLRVSKEKPKNSAWLGLW
jgi:hypothetical protein